MFEFLSKNLKINKFINFFQFISTFYPYNSKNNYNYFLHIQHLTSNVINAVDIQEEDFSYFINNIKELSYYILILKYSSKADQHNINKLFQLIIYNICYNNYLKSKPLLLKKLHILLQEFFKLEYFDNPVLNSFLFKKIEYFQNNYFLQKQLPKSILNDKYYLFNYTSEEKIIFQDDFPIYNFIKFLNFNKNSLQELLILFNIEIQHFSLIDLEKLYYFLSSINENIKESLPEFIFNKIIENQNYEYILSDYFSLCIHNNYSQCKEKINELFHITHIFEEYDIKNNIENF